MSLANGRHYLAIPGPSVAPDRVLQAMHRAAPNIYTGPLVDMVEGIVPDLNRVARSSGKVAMYIGNGHAAWEAALVNTLQAGDKVLVLATGRFAKYWALMAETVGVEVEILDFGNRAPIDPARVEERLRAPDAGAFRAVLAVQVDTATSVRNDISIVRAALDAARYPGLFMVDCIACLGCDEFRMDDWGVDVMVAGCQKGLMTPPGMAFVYFNDKADSFRQALPRVSSYWDWRPRTTPDGFYQYFCGTAPTHHLYGLREALTMLLDEEGLDAVLDRHAVLAQAVWAALEAWGEGTAIESNIAPRGFRSHAVTTVRMTPPQATELREWVTETAGITLGIGLGMADDNDPAWHGFLRIGHMGHVNAHMVLGVLGAMDAGLKALGIPHGGGALEAASRVCAVAPNPPA
ncbi:MAG: aminotransferase class V-fold PLP-dependent enzyme [Dinoroseobacter sp.]|nr:aminotransferase class V-fold PLP-dependent enzyme [Dinoroseobacter sp.]MDJ0993205.1 aminotransferase class V-fold PLP-dependent enzyme [Dinoroseobacter sp.]